MKALPRLTARLVARWLPRRRKDVHKGDVGHVLILAGSRGMSGAAVLCAQGALRGGAGLVTIACPTSQQPIVAASLVEALTLPLPETRAGSVARQGVTPVLRVVQSRRINAVVIGPGLSVHPDSTALVERLLLRLSTPVVLDADGLNALAQGRSLASRNHLLRARQAPTILSPHPGELARWVGMTAEEVQRDRVRWATRVSREGHLICVLKGYHTVIASDRKTVINPTGNAGMATGGSGDVLAGLMGALLGQGRDPWRAACVGVYLHGLAGDIAVRTKAQIGLIASDIADTIPLAMRRLATVSLGA
ncbi:MAG: NAD(P)H-hydrate dehydratase [Elusimicrobia bacterium]|nr:NAD(P)H-hydrate dehydratase [Elusimicrobiota bacterium]